MGKRIWIVNYYTSPTCSNPRYLKLAKHFVGRGFEVVTFYADYKCEDSEAKFVNQTIDGLDFVKVKSPHYVGNGLKRMLSIWKFAVAIQTSAKRFPKPDVILHNIHPPFDYPVVKLAKKMKCKYVAEAWDLWPEFFVTMGLLSANNPAMKLAYAIEKRYYYAADDIIFTFLGAFDYLKRQGWMKDQGGKIDPTHLHYINNGVDLEQFNIDREEHPRMDDDLNDPSIKKIIYLGSINKANNVKTLIDAAAILKDLPQYRFFIYGNGADRQALERYVIDNNINNVVFKEKGIPLKECAWLVSQASVNVMNYERGFGKWGVSSGKLFLYLAAGKPVLCNVDIAYDNVIRDNNLGFCMDIDSPEGFAELIRRLAEQPKDEYEAMCKRVREVAKQFDYEVLAKRELGVIEG